MGPERKKHQLSLAEIHKQRAEQEPEPETLGPDEYQVFFDQVDQRWDEAEFRDFRDFLKNFQQLKKSRNKDLVCALGIEVACLLEAYVIMDVLVSLDNPIRIMGLVPAVIFGLNALIQIGSNGFGKGRQIVEEKDALIYELDSLGFKLPLQLEGDESSELLDDLVKVMTQREAAELEKMNQALRAADQNLRIGDDGEIIGIGDEDGDHDLGSLAATLSNQ